MTDSAFNWKRLHPLLWPLVLTLWALASTPTTDLRLIALAAAWMTGTAFAFPTIAQPIVWLRRWPLLLWLLWILALLAIIVTWLLRFQPAASVPFTTTESLWLIGCGSALLLPLAGQRRASGAPGWLAGPLITVTTLLLLVIALELGLRYVWVMSDNFQFSSMHRNWSALYWQPLNALNYRDYAIPESDTDTQRILVMGDSLASGYGINQIDDTFPHLLANALGDEAVSVHLVAQPGWGITTAFNAMREYPLQPDVLILSHYINDINEGPAGQQYGRGFPQIRLEPDDDQRWWTERFYLANFLYYRVFLYTQHDSVGLYNDWVAGAYSDDTVWRAYQDEIRTITTWAQERDVPLIVLLWPNLVDVAGSQGLTQPVAQTFREQGVTVVDMSDHLRGEPAARLTVNLFDAHPSVYSHRVAADALAEIVTPLLSSR